MDCLPPELKLALLDNLISLDLSLRSYLSLSSTTRFYRALYLSTSPLVLETYLRTRLALPSTEIFLLRLVSLQGQGAGTVHGAPGPFYYRGRLRRGEEKHVGPGVTRVPWEVIERVMFASKEKRGLSTERELVDMILLSRKVRRILLYLFAEQHLENISRPSFFSSSDQKARWERKLDKVDKKMCNYEIDAKEDGGLGLAVQRFLYCFLSQHAAYDYDGRFYCVLRMKLGPSITEEEEGLYPSWDTLGKWFDEFSRRFQSPSKEVHLSSKSPIPPSYNSTTSPTSSRSDRLKASESRHSVRHSFLDFSQVSTLSRTWDCTEVSPPRTWNCTEASLLKTWDREWGTGFTGALLPYALKYLILGSGSIHWIYSCLFEERLEFGSVCRSIVGRCWLYEEEDDHFLKETFKHYIKFGYD